MDLTLLLQELFCLSLPGDWGHKREHPTALSTHKYGFKHLISLWEEEK